MSHLKYPRSVNPELHNVNMLALVFTRKLSCIMWKDFLLGLSSSDAWWRWTITALGSTTAVDIQTTPTLPVSYGWPHWAAHMLPSSLLWLCTHSSTKGWVRTTVICIIHLLVCCVNKIPFTLVLTQIASFFFSLSLQISFGWSTVKIDMSAVHQFQPIMPFSVPAFAATLFALGLALGTTIAVGMLFFIQVRDLQGILFPS